MFHDFIYQPLYNILIFLYDFLPGRDFGIAIIFFTITLRLVLVPLYKKQVESQKKLQENQPRIKEIQQKYKNDKEKQTREIMEFYKKNKINPFAGCLPIVVQLFFLIAIYQILFNISKENFVVRANELYTFIANPGIVNHFFLGIIDLSRPNVYLAIIAAIAQYYQSKMLFANQPMKLNKDVDKPDFFQIMNRQMLYLGPLLTLFIGVKFPAGLALYWLTSTLFMIAQQWQMDRKIVRSTQRAN